MSWLDLLPPRIDPSRMMLAAITVSAGGKTPQARAGLKRRLYVTLRPNLLPDAAKWVAPDMPVTAQLGRGEHAGCLRIARGGLFRIGRSGGTARQPMLSLPIGDQLEPGAWPPTIVTFTADADALVITLPPWAGGPQHMEPMPLAAPPAAKAAPKPPKLATASAPPTKEATPASPPPIPEEPAEATFEEIRKWAKRFGITYDGSNIGAVNRKRRECGYSNFVQIEARAA